MEQDHTQRGRAAEVPELRWLRRLVTGLAVVMALGVAAVAGVLWLRLSAPPLPTLPDRITLPEGARPAAVTFARDWTVVVTETGEILLYTATGHLHSRTTPN